MNLPAPLMVYPMSGMNSNDDIYLQDFGPHQLNLTNTGCKSKYSKTDWLGLYGNAFRRGSCNDNARFRVDSIGPVSSTIKTSFSILFHMKPVQTSDHVIIHFGSETDTFQFGFHMRGRKIYFR